MYDDNAKLARADVGVTAVERRVMTLLELTDALDELAQRLNANQEEIVRLQEQFEKQSVVLHQIGAFAAARGGHHA